MNILDGIKNFLMFVNDHWTEVIVVIGLILALYKKISEYLAKTNDEKIVIAKKQIQETILKLVTEAEKDYDSWVKAGAVKRAQVIAKIFAEYPILNRVTDQESLIAEIDDFIDNALKELRKIIEENNTVRA